MAKMKSITSVRRFGHPPPTRFHRPYPLGGRYTDYALQVPLDVYDRIVRAAVARGWSRSQWVREALFARMDADEARVPLDLAHPATAPPMVLILSPQPKGSLKHLGFRMFTEDIFRIDQHSYRNGQTRTGWMRDTLVAAVAREEEDRP